MRMQVSILCSLLVVQSVFVCQSENRWDESNVKDCFRAVEMNKENIVNILLSRWNKNFGVYKLLKNLVVITMHLSRDLHFFLLKCIDSDALQYSSHLSNNSHLVNSRSSFVNLLLSVCLWLPMCTRVICWCFFPFERSMLLEFRSSSLVHEWMAM